jgi:diaminohydroxyphosphoribosylaminopyrimidine deaminase/5-amino-6-(5-phosphoribosylamino)uracil reductase
MNIHDHAHLMSQALSLAAKGRNTASPNPMVGCVIVRDQQIIGQGYHQFPGGPHAEVIALQQAGIAAKGATAYVTLEPCCHYGKTPPCTQALIRAGIQKIFTAGEDPNPLVSGKGIEELRAAGITVEVGLLAQEAEQLNEKFFHFMRTKKPYVITKWAMSLDGKTKANQSDGRQISGSEAELHTHALRQECDAILVGANTIIHDNPKLTARPESAVAKQPIRIILSGKTKLSEQATVFQDGNPTIVAITTLNKHLYENFSANQTELMLIEADAHQQISLPALLTELGKRRITSLLVEGGMSVHHNFFMANLVNKVHMYLAPAIIGSFDNKKYYRDISLNNLGSDYHFSLNLMEKQYV